MFSKSAKQKEQTNITTKTEDELIGNKWLIANNFRKWSKLLCNLGVARNILAFKHMLTDFLLDQLAQT